jgi:hypothetical protein
VIDWFIVDTPGVSEGSAKAKVKVKERKKKQTLDELTVLRDTYRVYTYRQTLTDGESGRRTGMALEDFLFFLFRCCYLLLWKSVLFIFFFFFLSSFFFLMAFSDSDGVGTILQSGSRVGMEMRRESGI